MMLSDLASITGGRLIGKDQVFSAISTDSRTLPEGAVFFALKGERFDAEKFIDDVRDKALAVVVREPHDALPIPQIVVADTATALGQLGAEKRRRYKGKVVAITGSSGKTTVKSMMRSVFEQAGSVLATKGNFNNHIGVPLTLVELDDQDRAVIEAGTSGMGEIAQLTDLIQPDVALVNNIGMAHYAGFGSVKGIANEKAEIYHTLKADQVAVINLNDAFAAFFIDKTQTCRQFGFSLAKPSRFPEFPVVYAQDMGKQSTGELSFEIVYEQQTQKIHLPMPGIHNVSNALATAACALAVGLDLPTIASGLKDAKSASGRLEFKNTVNGGLIIDDSYNANPASVMAAIDVLSEQPRPKKILILGDMGELGSQTEEAHRTVGAYAGQKSCIDHVFICGEFKHDVAAGAGEKAQLYEDQMVLAEAVKALLDEQSVVLVKGSRSARMEWVVDALVAPTMEAERGAEC